MNFKIKKFFANSIIFLFFSFSIYSIEDQTKKLYLKTQSKLNNCPIGYFYIDANEQGSAGGHTGFLINEFVYHYQRVQEKFFILDKTDLNFFLFNYSRIQNRNLYFICIESFSNKELNKLFYEFELEYQKNNFYSNEILYWENLKNTIEKKEILIPTIFYFDFNESSFLEEVKSNFDSKEIIEKYDGDLILNLLEKFYKINSKNLIIKKDYFIEIKNLNLEELEKDYFKNNLNFVIKEWENRIKELSNSFRSDKYLVILESFIYLEILKHLYSEGKMIFPYMIVKDQKYIYDIPNKKIDFSQVDLNNFLLKNITNEFYKKIDKLFLLINQKKSIFEIQIILQEISNVINQILLIQERPDLISNLRIYILNSPQISYRLELVFKFLDQNKKKILLTYINHKLELYKEKTKEIFEYQLITKNCVTKLFDFISQNSESEFLQQLNQEEKKVYHTIQGNFIPWVSYKFFKKVIRKYQIPYKEYYFPSFRNELLGELKKSNQSTIKEISTLTSDFYFFHSQDSFFIFFTENVFLIRPVFGIINTIGSTIYFAFDLVKKPYDYFLLKKNSSISTNLNGIFFSTIEIIFISIRKGTFLPNRLKSKYQKLYFSLPKFIIVYD